MPTSEAIVFATSHNGSGPFRLVKVDIASHAQTDLGLVPAPAGHALTFVRLARPVQRGVVVFSVNSKVYAGATDERRPFWSAPWQLEGNAYSETVFLRSP